LFRIVGLAVLPINLYGGIIIFDLFDLVFFIFDLGLYRQEKLNIKTYAIERILVLMAVNGSIFAPNATSTLGVVGVSMGLVFIIKLYYTAITVKAYIDANREEGASEMDLSDVINMSVKEKKGKSDDL
jgi:hypothetical protein